MVDLSILHVKELEPDACFRHPLPQGPEFVFFFSRSFDPPFVVSSLHLIQVDIFIFVSISFALECLGFYKVQNRIKGVML